MQLLLWLVELLLLLQVQLLLCGNDHLATVACTAAWYTRADACGARASLPCSCLWLPACSVRLMLLLLLQHLQGMGF